MTQKKRVKKFADGGPTDKDVYPYTGQASQSPYRNTSLSGMADAVLSMPPRPRQATGGGGGASGPTQSDGSGGVYTPEKGANPINDAVGMAQGVGRAIAGVPAGVGKFFSDAAQAARGNGDYGTLRAGPGAGRAGAFGSYGPSWESKAPVAAGVAASLPGKATGAAIEQAPKAAGVTAPAPQQPQAQQYGVSPTGQAGISRVDAAGQFPMYTDRYAGPSQGQGDNSVAGMAKALAALSAQRVGNQGMQQEGPMVSRLQDTSANDRQQTFDRWDNQRMQQLALGSLPSFGGTASQQHARTALYGQMTAADTARRGQDIGYQSHMGGLQMQGQNQLQNTALQGQNQMQAVGLQGQNQLQNTALHGMSHLQGIGMQGQNQLQGIGLNNQGRMQETALQGENQFRTAQAGHTLQNQGALALEQMRNTSPQAQAHTQYYQQQGNLAGAQAQQVQQNVNYGNTEQGQLGKILQYVMNTPEGMQNGVEWATEQAQRIHAANKVAAGQGGSSAAELNASAAAYAAMKKAQGYAGGGQVESPEQVMARMAAKYGMPQEQPAPQPQAPQQPQPRQQQGQGVLGRTMDVINERQRVLKEVSRAEGGEIPARGVDVSGRQVRGPGTGKSDSIPAEINGDPNQPAALSDGEFVMPVETVRHFGLARLNKMVQASRKGLDTGQRAA